MARPEEYAQWIVDNQDKQGTPEFETVANAYELAKSQSTSFQSEPEASGFGVGLQMAAPAVTGAAYAAPTGLAKYGRDIVDVAKAGAKNLSNRTVLQTAGDVAGIATHGVPWGSIAKGAVDPTGMSLTQAARGAMDVAKAAPGYLAGMAGPAIRGAARVAGPVGMAYDVYQAGQFAQESELGRRLAEEGAANLAPQAFQNISVSGGGQYDIQPQEAANLLASNDERTINIYGGRQRLQAIAAGQSVGKPSAAMPAIPQSQPYQAPPAPTNWMEKALQMASQYGPAQATVRKRPYTIGQ